LTYADQVALIISYEIIAFFSKAHSIWQVVIDKII